MAPSMARTRGGSDGATFSSRSKRPGFTEVSKQLLDRFLGRQLARFPAVAKEVEKSGIRLGQRSPRCRPPRVNERILAEEEAREARAVGRQLDPGRILGRETQQIGGGGAGREDSLLPKGQGSDMGHVGPAGPERRLPRPVVEPLTQPLDHTLAGQAGQRLRHRRERHAVKVGQPPEPLAAGFDPRADGLGGVFCTGSDSLFIGPHAVIIAQKSPVVKFYCY